MITLRNCIRMIRPLLARLAFLLLIPVQAHAQIGAGSTPEAGYWWNSNDPGSGFVIEVQGSNLFFAGFLYSDSGEATWLASTGIMASASSYTGQLTPYSGGQTLTGAYQPATQQPSIATISINFVSTTQAVLAWPGSTVPIQRFSFAFFAPPPPIDPQTGYWYNPAEGGRGFTIERQGNQIYLAGYMYDTAGNPLWYLASGALVNSTFQGTWQQYSGGLTFKSGYKPASVANANAGSVTLQFASPTSATLTLPDGRQIALSRYNFSGPPPVPANLWQPPAGATPATGNYVYLTAAAGEPLIGGNTYVFTPANAVLLIDGGTNYLEVRVVGGSLNFDGNFLMPAGVNPVAQGYYPNAISWPQSNSPFPAIGWSGNGIGCTTSGWFAVDDIAFSLSGSLLSYDLRFAQYCDNAGVPMYGKVHYNANDAAVGTSAPVVPIPSNLWQPSIGSTPASGNYVFLQSDPGDPVGQGKTVTYAPPACMVQGSSGNNSFDIDNAVAYVFLYCSATTFSPSGNFSPMNKLPLQLGYYPNAVMSPFGNPAFPQMFFSGAQSCTSITGWFTIDNIAFQTSYMETFLSALDVRFEQHCNGAAPALRGKIHWTAN